MRDDEIIVQFEEVENDEELVVRVEDINYIPEYKEAEMERRINETERKANEVIRQSNETNRINLYNDMLEKVNTGYFNGEDGYSPIATVSKSGKVATITITDKNGTTTAEVRDGEDGQGSGDMSKSTYDTNDNGIVDNAEKVNNHTVLSDVPADAVFTDTTYESKTAASGGTDVSLVTTGEKYIWNNKVDSSALNSKQDTLVSGNNIKTINNQTVLGSGNITISGGNSEIFNSVSSMKSADLAVGTYAVTSGYYSANDGGGAEYKIISGTYTDDGGSYIALNNGLYAELIVRNNTVLVDTFGTKRNSSNMDTTKIQNAFNFAVSTNNNIAFSNSSYYIDDQITINNTALDKDIIINGNGANICLKNDNAGFKAFYIKAKSLKINNLTIDGINTTQDQFAITDINELKLYTAFDILTDRIELNDVNILNMYGNAFIFYNYSSITAKNIYINNVGGHWYQNNTYDAFGDAFYFGAHSDRADVYLENVKATGKYKNTTLSRIGITIENLNNQLTDTITNIDMVSCYFYNYDRIIHAEAIRGNAIVNWHIGEATGNVFGFNFNTNASQLTINGDEITMNFTEQNYNGSTGQYKCVFNYNNCVINTGVQSLGMFSAKGTYTKCTINNINKTQFNSAGKILLTECELNYATTMVQHLIYNGDITFDRCSFNCSSAISMDNNFTAEKIISCTFNKVYPNAATKPKFLDLNSKVYTASGFSLNEQTRRSLHMTNVYDDTGKLIMTPHISQVFPMEDVSQENCYGRRTIPADGTIALVPSFDGMITRPNNKYILITIGASGWTTQYTGRQFVSFYYNIVTTNASNVMTVSETKTFGTVPSDYVLTIDDVNKTVASSGQYTDTCNQWFLPYNYVEYINGFISKKEMIVTYTDNTTETINMVVSA